MKLFARQQIVDALIEGMVLPNEPLSFPPNALALIGFLEVIADLLHTGFDVLVPGAVISFAQHLGEARCAVAEIKPAAQNHHPGTIRRVLVAPFGAGRVDAERDIGTRADGGEGFAFDRTATPVERLAPFLPAFAPDLEIIFPGDLEQKLRARCVVACTNETDV